MNEARSSRSALGRPVLLVSLAENYGGADVRVIQIARALHGRRPYAVAVLKDSTTHRRLESFALRALPVPFGRGDPRVALCLYRFVRQQGIEVVESHNPQSHIWSLIAARMAGVRTRIWTIHSDYRKAGTPLKSFVLDRLLRVGASLGCRFIVVSGREVEHLRSMGVPAGRIHFSANGVSAPEVTASSSLRSSLGGGAGTKILCGGARLDAIKGHSVLIKALQLLRSSCPDLRCVIFGDGPMKQRLQQEVAEAGLSDVVFFAGFRSDAAATVVECDLFCLPSHSEGMPFALLEAALLGVPAVVSAVGEIPSHFHHPDMARLVPPGDPNALAQEISWVLEHPKEAAEMAAAAKRMVLDRFSVARMTQDTFAVYDSI